MDLTDDEVIQIIKLVNESSFDELQLDMNGVKLVVRRGGATVRESEPAAPGIPAGSPSARDSVEATSAQAECAPVASTGLLEIKAPSVGTFYRAPKPDAPPFVEMGSFITEDDTVCILEIMKCFVAVKAKVRGRIARICAENEKLVEFEQQLFLVDPTGKP